MSITFQLCSVYVPSTALSLSSPHSGYVLLDTSMFRERFCLRSVYGFSYAPLIRSDYALSMFRPYSLSVPSMVQSMFRLRSRLGFVRNVTAMFQLSSVYVLS